MMPLLKKALFGMLIAVCLVLCACGKSTPTVVPEGEESASSLPKIDIGKHIEFSNGLTQFYNDFSKLTDYIRELMKNSNTSDTLEGKQEYYDDMLLLLSITDLELSVLDELDMLPFVQGNTDRAEGKLLISEHYGYKINKGAFIEFGYSENEGKALTGKFDKENHILTFKISDKIEHDVVAETIVEAAMLENDIFALRSSKVLKKSGDTVAATKSVCILIKDDTFSLGYYDGNEGVSGYIAFEKLFDYNMDAIMFGVERKLNIEMKIN